MNALLVPVRSATYKQPELADQIWSGIHEMDKSPFAAKRQTLETFFFSVYSCILFIRIKSFDCLYRDKSFYLEISVTCWKYVTVAAFYEEHCTKTLKDYMCYKWCKTGDSHQTWNAYVSSRKDCGVANDISKTTLVISLGNIMLPVTDSAASGSDSQMSSCH